MSETTAIVSIADIDDLHLLQLQLFDIGRMPEGHRPVAKMTLSLSGMTVSIPPEKLVTVEMHVMGLVCVDRVRYRMWRFEAVVLKTSDDRSWPSRLPFKPGAYVGGKFDAVTKKGAMRRLVSVD